MYDLVIRLVALRETLRAAPEPIPFGAVQKALPAHYDDNESGRRRFRRDVEALELLGAPVARVSRGRQGTTYRI